MVKTNPFVSSKPSKVRKNHYNATKDKKHLVLSAAVSKELRESEGIRSLPIQRGDKVQFRAGKNTNSTGVVTRVDLRAMKVYVDSAKRKTSTSIEKPYPIHPSLLFITEYKKTKHRKELIEKRANARKLYKEKLAGSKS